VVATPPTPVAGKEDKRQRVTASVQSVPLMWPSKDPDDYTRGERQSAWRSRRALGLFLAGLLLIITSSLFDSQAVRIALPVVALVLLTCALVVETRQRRQSTDAT
jgi:Flp pilus assembly protein TadB